MTAATLIRLALATALLGAASPAVAERGGRDDDRADRDDDLDDADLDDDRDASDRDDRDDRALPDQRRRDDDGVVIVNGAASFAGPDVLAKLRKRLDALGALNPTAPAVAAALEGTSPIDLDPIIAAYQDLDYDQADQLIDVALGDLLATGDPDQLARPVAELLHWRGLVAAALGARDEAVLAFAASQRIDPDRPVDRAALPPRVRALVDRAAKPTRRAGKVELDLSEPLDLSVDGGRRRKAQPDVRLEAGLHLLVLTAPDGAHDAALVLVEADRVTVHRPELAGESDAAFARRLADDTVAAGTDRKRLDRAGPLAELTGARRLLVIEGDDADHLQVRVYDLQARTVSSPLELRQATRPSVLAALIGVDDAAIGRDAGPPWHKRWYVWAAAGVVVAGAATGAYFYSQRDANRVTGF